MEFLYTNDYTEPVDCMDNIATLLRNIAADERNTTANVWDLCDAELFELFTLHTSMYALADKYAIPSLSLICIAKFQSVTKTTTLWPLLKLVPAIYESTPDSDRGLRDILIRELRLRSREFIGNEHEYDPKLMLLGSMDGIEAFRCDMVEGLLRSQAEQLACKCRNVDNDPRLTWSRSTGCAWNNDG